MQSEHLNVPPILISTFMVGVSPWQCLIQGTKKPKHLHHTGRPSYLTMKSAIKNNNALLNHSQRFFSAISLVLPPMSPPSWTSLISHMYICWVKMCHAIIRNFCIYYLPHIERRLNRYCLRTAPRLRNIAWIAFSHFAGGSGGGAIWKTIGRTIIFHISVFYHLVVELPIWKILVKFTISPKRGKNISSIFESLKPPPI